MKRKLLLLAVTAILTNTLLNGQALYVPGANGSTPGIGVSSNGNVGIGTGSPQSTLDVNGNIQISNAFLPMGLMTEVGGYTPLLNLSVNFREPNVNNSYIGGAFRIDTRTDEPLFQWLRRSAGTTIANESLLMTLTKDGNLGINTLTPTHKLEVNGEAYITDILSLNNKLSLGSFTIGNTNTGEAWIGRGNDRAKGSVTFQLGNSDNSIFDILDYRWTREIFQVKNNGDTYIYGNLLINKTTQSNSSYKLDVAGKIRADEIVVNTTGADFVFEPSYQLMSLQELETYLKANRHLPGIATAAEMQENGVSAGEMQTKLLQKVEELTLYVIEQQKQLEHLQKENSEKDHALMVQQQSLSDLKNEIQQLKVKINE
jgi:hypothetical protein